MAPVSPFLKYKHEYPVITTEGDRIKVTIRRGYEETTYSGRMEHSELDISREGVFIGDFLGKVPGLITSSLNIRLTDVTSETRKVHADPHFSDVDKHGRFCICGCPQCNKIGDPDDECVCADCEFEHDRCDRGCC